MILPEGVRGAAFGTASDGDPRTDTGVRRTLSAALGISPDWATISQVHGRRVLIADAPGLVGEGDAIVTEVVELPIAVATADCVPVILEADRAVAVVHAGWRGLEAGTITAALDTLAARGHAVRRAAIGPAIGPCCYEVRPDVADRFPGFVATAASGAASVDLVGVATAQLAGIDVWSSDRCTVTDFDLHSHRENGTMARQVAVAWLPEA